MAKPRSPLLSLGARGTIGDALTYQKRGQDTIARKKPIPKDPYSLAQAYQRWDHRDYAYLWTLESEASKQTYRTRASRYHITGFNLWMKEHLRDLPDLAGRWHLDEQAGANVRDSSPNNNHGTLYGALHQVGRIGRCLYFDDINDYVRFPFSSTLNITDAITLEAFVYPSTLDSNDIIVKETNFDLSASSGFPELILRIAGAYKFSRGDTKYPLGAWSLLTATYDKDDIAHQYGRVYLNGEEVTYTVQDACAGQPIEGDTRPVDLAKSWYRGWYGGLIDEARLYSYALEPGLIKLHSERRYPA